VPLAAALLGAALLVVVPAVLAGRGGADAPFRALRTLEPTFAGHQGAHDDTKANVASDRRLMRRCAKPGYRRAHRARCPSARAFAAGTQRPADIGSPEVNGRWGAPFSVRSWAIHAILLPTGKVLWFSKKSEDVGGHAFLWDPATGRERQVDPPPVDYPDGKRLPANIFCAGHAVLPDGRVLVAGGNLAFYESDEPGKGWKGSRWLFTFNPWNETWTRQSQDMSGGRWYPTVTTLPDGRALIVGGWDDSGDQIGNEDVEVFTPSPNLDGADGRVATVAQRPWPQLYPHMFVLPDTTVAGRDGSKVLMAGPAGRYPANAAILDTGTWTWSSIPFLPTTREFGAAVLMPGGPDGSREVMLTGGSDGPIDPTATATTAVLDLDDPGAGFRPGPPMTVGRNHPNTVLLPDESMVTVGGGAGAGGLTGSGIYAGPVFASELYAPGQGWRAPDVQQDARTYHSTALLLPDGRVLSAGDDRSTHIPLDARTAEIYSPPYLFRGERPRITFAPGAVRYGAELHVGTPAPGDIAKAVLMRAGSVTHATDMDQRSIRLRMSAEPGGLALRSPANASLAPPGWYMLFLVDRDGVPSTARWVHLDPAAGDAPPLPEGAGPSPGPGSAAAAPGALADGPDRPPVGSPPAAADRRAPRLTLGRATVRRRARALSVRVTLTADERASALVRLVGLGGASVSRRISLAAARPTAVTLRLARAPRTLAAARLRLVARATDDAGNARTLTRPLR
jgi:hypothetical protein